MVAKALAKVENAGAVLCTTHSDEYSRGFLAYFDV